jgi:hypothetical protein
MYQQWRRDGVEKKMVQDLRRLHNSKISKLYTMLK